MFLTNTATNSPINFYAEQAAAAPTGMSGISPNYYDHLRITINKGIFEFARPIKGEEPYLPFDPSDNFNLRDIHGNHITHAFLGLDATIVGYFIGGKLSNYEQELPNERKGAHCETIKADLQMGDGTTITVNGRTPLQSSVGVHFSFRSYNADPNAPGKYAGQRVLTSGRATPEFAAQMNRPEIMSCKECVEQNLDRFGKNSCRTWGEMVLFVRRVAIKGAGNKIVWINVADLGIPELGNGFVAVTNVGASDLRKPEYRLDAKVNEHIAPNVTFAHDYVSGLYRRSNPAMTPMYQSDYGLMQTIAYPTQVWVAELSKAFGANKFVALYNECPTKSQAPLEDKHADLQEALTSYFNDRRVTAIKANPESLALLPDSVLDVSSATHASGTAATPATPAQQLASASPTVPPVSNTPGTNLEQLTQASNLFSGFNFKAS